MSERLKPPVVMSIAGLDPSGGAGVLADIKTISAFGCHGAGVVTSITYQNTQGVFGANHLTSESVRQQMLPLFDDFDIAAIKTGILPTAEIIAEVASVIASKAVPIVVVDPVLKSTSGFELIDDRAIEALKTHLLPLAIVVTPNAAEALRLSGISSDVRSTLRASAEAIRKLGARAVLITGGESANDFLLDVDGEANFTGPRIESRNTHGTGCTLASAIACLLARGQMLRDSIPIAKRFVSEAILRAPDLGRGNGPLEHSPDRFQE